MLIAGGSGITPMMSMLRYIDDLCLPTEITLIYCVRTEQDVIFERELFELGCRSSRFRYVLVLSQPSATWKGAHGHLTRELLETEIWGPKESTFFLCGPPPMMQSARELLASIGVNPANIRQENFGSPDRAASVPPAAIQAFAIRFTRSRKVCDALSSQTILEAAESNGVGIPFGCRQGECGSCTTRLLAGEVEMERQDGLTTELKEEGYILPCVSHFRSDISLEV